MAEYKSFQNGVTVNGEAILGVVTALATGQEARLQILRKHGIDPEPGKWYPLQAWLDAFKEIASSIGTNTLFMIGKTIADKAKFPPIDSIETALNVIDKAYKMNNIGGDVGEYVLKEFNARNKTAVLYCRNPYPSEFDRGLITAIVRKFKPIDSFKAEVLLDTTKETRASGGDSCTFKIAW